MTNIISDKKEDRERKINENEIREKKKNMNIIRDYICV